MPRAAIARELRLSRLEAIHELAYLRVFLAWETPEHVVSCDRTAILADCSEFLSHLRSLNGGTEPPLEKGERVRLIDTPPFRAPTNTTDERDARYDPLAPAW
jgi:hypothetical protein